jgi:hypothetical protein
MTVASLPRALIARNVREAPEVQGVFTLWDGDERVYIGHTPGNSSLRDCLCEQLQLREKGRLQASHFSWETTAVGRMRQEELLSLCLEKQGDLPRYNRGDSLLGTDDTPATDLRARP